MQIGALICLSFALAMDAFAVSLSDAACYSNARLKIGLGICFSFGVAQGVMPLLGWLMGSALTSFIMQINHLIVGGIFAAIGIKMMIETYKESKNGCVCKSNKQLSLRIIFLQALATSIDALVVGLSLAFLKTNIILASAVIALVTFMCCFAAFIIGRKFGLVFREKAQYLGSALLLLLAVKNFLEQFFS